MLALSKVGLAPNFGSARRGTPPAMVSQGTKRKHQALHDLDALAVGVPLIKMKKLFKIFQDLGAHEEEVIPDHSRVELADVIDMPDFKYGEILQRMDLETSKGHEYAWRTPSPPLPSYIYIYNSKASQNKCRDSPNQVSGPYEWEYVSPAALLHGACHHSSRFGLLLQRSTHPVARLVIYTDEFCPGNALRPDKGSSMECIYYTFLDFPPWWRMRVNGWFFFGALLSKVVGRIEGGMSHVMRHIVSSFFPVLGPSFEVGCEFRAGGQEFTVSIKKVDLFMEDLDGYRKQYAWKGCSGSRPCGLCTNMVAEHGKKKLDCRSGPNILFQKATYRQFRLHTAQTMWECVDALADSVGQVTKREFGIRQQCWGLTHQPNGLLLDKRLRKYVDSVESTFPDFAHTFLGSGGIAQYHAYLHSIYIYTIAPLSQVGEACRSEG